MKNLTIKTTILLMAGLLLASHGFAAVSADQADRLGKDLTPMGGIKSGNADGTIPAWDGGITTPPAGYEKGMHHPDPYAADKVLLTVTADNVGQYADKLTAGQQAMLKAYPSYKMNVYPTHRSAAAPQRIYDATKAVATTAQLTEGGNGDTGALNGDRKSVV